jgi:hypothetical protein
MIGMPRHGAWRAALGLCDTAFRMSQKAIAVIDPRDFLGIVL